MSTVSAGDIVLTTLNEALDIVRRKQSLAETNLKSSTLKVEALRKAVADYNEQLTLEMTEKNSPKKGR